VPKDKKEESLLLKIRRAIMAGDDEEMGGGGERRDKYLKELEEYSVKGGKKPKRNKKK
jgi:hypothetical protein